MKKIFAVLIILLALAVSAGCVATEQNSGIDIVNSDGSVTQLDKLPERIILLNSNAGEILYLLGDAEKIVGISQSIANNKEQAAMYKDAEIIGAWNEPNVEYLINLNADLVIGYATSKPKNAEVLAAVGIPVIYVDCTKPATMAQDIAEIGKLSGNSKKAQEIADFFTETMNEISRASSEISAQKTVYAESYTDYWGQGTDSGIGQLISHVDGLNIMTMKDSQKISNEWVVASSPQVVVKLVNSMDNAERQYAELLARTGFDMISAVQEGNVWLIRNDLTYGPRSCAAAAALFEMLYPDAEHDFSAKEILEEFNSRFGTVFDTENITWPKLS